MKLRIPNNIFYQFLFILCVAVPYLDIFELTIGTWSLAFLITIRNNYSISLFKLIIPYILILLIAFVVSFNYDYQKYFIFRDVTYLLKPVIGFFLGYQLFHRNLNNAFKLIVTTGVFIAVCHIIIILIAIFFYGARTVADLRHHSGYFSDYEIYTLIILIFYKKFQLDYSKKTVRILTVLVGFSAFMYLARTNFIQFLILFLVLKGYFELNKKSILIFVSIIITSIISYSIILYLT